MTHDLPMLMFINISAAGLIFAWTWGETRKFARWAQILVAIATWFAIAIVEPTIWAFKNIDRHHPLPTSPLFIPAHVIYAVLFCLTFAVSFFKKNRSKTKQGDC